MISDDELGHTVSYWPSVSDLFMTLFVVAIALVGAVVLVVLPDPTDQLVVARIIGPVNQIRAELGTLPPVEDGSVKTVVEAALQETAVKTVTRLEGYADALGELGQEIVARIDLEEKIEALQAESEQYRAALLDAQTAKKNAKQTAEALTQATSELEEARNRELLVLADIETARAEVEALEQKVITLELVKGLRLDDKPPIITIADADKRHFFSSGSAALTPDFEADLAAGGFQEIAAEILKRNRDGRQAVDTLEIIGHTDGVPVARRGNLDSVLPVLLDGDSSGFERLSPGSNNDLGLLRALAIKHAWSEFVEQHPENEQLRPIAVRTYSAGQTLPVDAGGYRAADARSRRIELRLTKLIEESAPVPGF
jgi:flagellar motor protein MotB